MTETTDKQLSAVSGNPLRSIPETTDNFAILLFVFWNQNYAETSVYPHQSSHHFGEANQNDP
jgi:hypothetical protein